MAGEKWVTFDCFGTLMDWQSGFRAILAKVAGDRVDDLVQAYHHAELSTEGANPTRSYKDVLTLALQKAADDIGLAITPAQARLLVTEWASLPIFSDTEDALNALRRDGFRLGILTNCDNDLFEQTRSRFPVPIDMVVTAEEVQSYKPGLAHFTAFESRSGAERSRWLHAAVSWWHDIRPAAELGIARVWVDRENSGHDPSIASARIPDLRALPNVARDLMASSDRI